LGCAQSGTIVNDTTRLIINCTIGPDSKWEREAKDFAGDLARFCPERNAYQYYSELEEGRKKNKQYLVLVREVSSDTYKQIKSLPFFSGTRTRRLVSDDRDLYLRKYPRGGLARRTIGDLNSRDTTREFSIGLEGSFYKDLMKYDLRTTLNIDFQEISEQIVQKAFKGSTDMGSVCLSIMDIHTGAIKTIVNLERMKNDDSPRENYNMYLSSTYEPGALFLPISYAVLMENAKININDSLLTSSVYSALEIPYRDPFLQNLSHIGDKICIKDGLVFSSNVICRYLVSQYFSSDCSAFYSSLDKLKLLSPLSFDIPAKCETKYIAPGDDGWEYNHLLLHCCGHGIEMPPILLHSFYNTIANGGIYVKPYIAESLEKDGEIKKDLRCRNSKKILSERTTECISNALMDVVSNGTPSHQFRNSRTLVAGKTGTTLMRTKQQYIHSSFIGYFPADKPVFSILVVCSPLKDSSSPRSLYGGTVPAMIANQVVDTLFNMNPNLIYR